MSRLITMTGLRVRIALSTLCGFTLIYPLHQVTHNHPAITCLPTMLLLPLICHHLHHLHPATIPHRFSFSSYFANEAHFAKFYGDDDFEHVCDEECEGTHSVELEDYL